MNHFEQVIALRAEVERLTARVSELEAAPVDWDAQRRRANELEAEVEQLTESLAAVDEESKERLIERDEARAARDRYQRDRDRWREGCEEANEQLATSQREHLDWLSLMEVAPGPATDGGEAP